MLPLALLNSGIQGFVRRANYIGTCIAKLRHHLATL
jgi:hypothetical protein